MNFRDELKNSIDWKKKGYKFEFDIIEYSEEIIIPNKGSLPKLFRYTKADYQNIRNLEKEQLYLSEAGHLNDVFEGISCEIDSDSLDDLHSLYDLAYIKSFTEKYNDLLMWSLYGDEYRGICVEYDLSKMKDNYYYHLFPVNYTSMRNVKFNLRIVAKSLNNLRIELGRDCDTVGIEDLYDVMPLYINKPECWSHESEWRFIVTFPQMHYSHDEIYKRDDDSSPNLFEIKNQLISFPYATAVYLGARMSGHIKDHIIEICKRINIPVYETNLHNQEYKLDATKVK